jgi:hypothetical protein
MDETGVMLSKLRSVKVLIGRSDTKDTEVREWSAR